MLQWAITVCDSAKQSNAASLNYMHVQLQPYQVKSKFRIPVLKIRFAYAKKS